MSVRVEHFILFYLKILFIHERETQAEGRSRLPAGSRCGTPIDPGTLGSRPEPKTDAQLLSHPGRRPFSFALKVESSRCVIIELMREASVVQGPTTLLFQEKSLLSDKVKEKKKFKRSIL